MKPLILVGTALIALAAIAQPATLAGFSSGGGFALRFAGSDRQKLFSNYLLLSPFISQNAPTYRPNSGGWVSVGLPRFVFTDRFAEVFKAVPVTLLPGIGHIPLTLEPAAVEAAITAVRSMNEPRR